MGSGVKSRVRESAGPEQGPSLAGSGGHIRDPDLHPQDKGRRFSSLSRRATMTAVGFVAFIPLSTHRASPQELEPT